MVPTDLESWEMSRKACTSVWHYRNFIIILLFSVLLCHGFSWWSEKWVSSTLCKECWYVFVFEYKWQKQKRKTSGYIVTCK